jgi:hypothetical protein
MADSHGPGVGIYVQVQHWWAASEHAVQRKAAPRLQYGWESPFTSAGLWYYRTRTQRGLDCYIVLHGLIEGQSRSRGVASRSTSRTQHGWRWKAHLALNGLEKPFFPAFASAGPFILRTATELTCRVGGARRLMFVATKALQGHKHEQDCCSLRCCSENV